MQAALSSVSNFGIDEKILVSVTDGAAFLGVSGLGLRISDVQLGLVLFDIDCAIKEIHELVNS